MNAHTRETVPVPCSPAEAFLNAALARVQNKSIRQWAVTPHNRPLWIKIAQSALDKGKRLDVEDDVIRFSTYVVCVAMGI